MEDKVFQDVREILLRKFPEARKDDINPYTSMYRDLNADSLDIVEICMELEEHFDIEDIQEEDAQSFCTAGDIVEYIRKKARGKR